MSTTTPPPLTIYGILVGRQETQEWHVSIQNTPSIDLRDLVRPWPVQVPDGGDLSGNANVDFNRFPVRVASVNQQRFAKCPAAHLYRHYVKFGMRDMTKFIEALNLGFVVSETTRVGHQDNVYMWLPVMHETCTLDTMLKLFGIQGFEEQELKDAAAADCKIDDIINGLCHYKDVLCVLSDEESKSAHRKMLGAYGLYNRPDQLAQRIYAKWGTPDGVNEAIAKQLEDAPVKIQVFGSTSVNAPFGESPTMSTEEMDKVVSLHETRKRLGQNEDAIGSRPTGTSELQSFSIS